VFHFLIFFNNSNSNNNKQRSSVRLAGSSTEFDLIIIYYSLMEYAFNTIAKLIHAHKNIFGSDIDDQLLTFPLTCSKVKRPKQVTTSHLRPSASLLLID